MAKSRDYYTSDTIGGKGFGSMSSPGMGRGGYSTKLKNPAPMPERGGFDRGLMVQPDKAKAMMMEKQEYNFRESERGMGSL